MIRTRGWSGRRRLAAPIVGLAALLVVPGVALADQGKGNGNSGRNGQGGSSGPTVETSLPSGVPALVATTTTVAVPPASDPGAVSTTTVTTTTVTATTVVAPSTTVPSWKATRAAQLATQLGSLITKIEQSNLPTATRDDLLRRLRAMRDAALAGRLPSESDLKALFDDLTKAGRSSDRSSTTSTTTSVAATTTSVAAATTSVAPSTTSGAPSTTVVDTTTTGAGTTTVPGGSAASESTSSIAPERPRGRAAVDAAIQTVNDSPLPEAVKQQILEVLAQAQAIIENPDLSKEQIAEQLRNLHRAEQQQRLEEAAAKLVRFSEKIATLAFDAGSLPGGTEMVVEVHDLLAQANELLAAETHDIETIKAAWKLLHQARTRLQQFLDAAAPTTTTIPIDSTTTIA